MTIEEEPIAHLLIEIVDDLIQDWGLDLDEPVGVDTLLVADLEFASVDVIQLCVAVEEHYGRKLGFQDLLMHDGSYVQDLALGEMVRFVGKQVSGV
ncbi:MAG: acyl carrier protein [bacterium TMED88]|nr:acyl carrier protein [Deltaproteobacteria bacterium]OUV31081.1 MAG: acyl carrier protein [bacterium TMED88]